AGSDEQRAEGIAPGHGLRHVARGHDPGVSEPGRQGGRGAGPGGRDPAAPEGAAAKERLETADVAACADQTTRVNRDVADVAGAAVGPSVQLAVYDNAAADTGAELHEQEVVD